MKSFKELGLNQELQATIEKLRITNPTKIQELSIPLILEGKDVIGESATGSGKTLAFGTGIVEKIIPGKGLQALILTPTRELANQVMDSLREFDYYKKLRIISIFGGVSMNPQISGLRKSEVVVATPGRLLDHIRRRTVNLSKIRYLVLDEVDRMFDMGFLEDVKQILSNCPKSRQNIFFSATIPPKVRELADHYMDNPSWVSAQNQVDPNKLKQLYYNVHKNKKLSLLVNLLKEESPGLVMVFCNTRRTTDFVAKNLKANGIQAIAIHGGLTQTKRSKSMDLFNRGKLGVLVCTDVAARGLHINNISHIYNYEVPRDPNDYVHRIGRTARAGEKGMVINLLAEHEDYDFKRIYHRYSYKVARLNKPLMKEIVILRRPHYGRKFRSNRRYG